MYIMLLSDVAACTFNKETRMNCLKNGQRLLSSAVNKRKRETWKVQC